MEHETHCGFSATHLNTADIFFRTAYRSGVTLATTALAKPISLSRGHFVSGLSTTFGTGSKHAMERGAIVQDVVALHVVLGRSSPLLPKSVSVSTQMAALRRLLYGWESTDKETGIWFRKAAEGVVPLVIEVDNADIMASLLILKADVEDKIGSQMRMVFSGATEAYLLANEISRSWLKRVCSTIYLPCCVYRQSKRGRASQSRQTFPYCVGSA